MEELSSDLMGRIHGSDVRGKLRMVDYVDHVQYGESVLV